MNSFILLAIFCSLTFALSAQHGEGHRYVVTMKKGSHDPLTAFKSNPKFGLMSRGDRLTALTDAIKAHSKSSQKEVLELLNVEKQKSGLSFSSLWISNKIVVDGMDEVLFDKLESLDVVTKVSRESVFHLFPTTFVKELTNTPQEITWGVDRVHASVVWAEHVNGTGVLVGSIDSGVMHTHEALVSTYVGAEEYGWFDGVEHQVEPYDDNGHGTHTMGTIVGQGGIGVAPGAKWMSCKGCNAAGYCYYSYLTACLQFMLCPTSSDGSESDCSKAPHLVSNSWGGPDDGVEGDLDDSLEALHAAGIDLIFSMGNSGPGCSSTGYPGNSIYTIGVGATTSSDQLSSFSSSGPGGLFPSRIKPEVIAPGSAVNSAYIGHDQAYASLSGTSMSCPHVAGVVALMRSKNPNVDTTNMLAVMIETSEHGILVSPSRNCGGVPDTVRPNYSTGYGIVNALTAVEMISTK